MTLKFEAILLVESMTVTVETWLLFNVATRLATGTFNTVSVKLPLIKDNAAKSLLNCDALIG